MSVNVLVIPEDHRKDAYMLKPVIGALFKRLDIPAKVQVCGNPLLGGVGEALKWSRIGQIIDQYRGMVRVFLLVVDRDGKDDRHKQLRSLEAQATSALDGTNRRFVADHAWQEMEVWVLGGLDSLPKAWTWAEVRADPNPKETYFRQIAKDRGLLRAPHEGRAPLAEEAAKNYELIRKRCPELADLENRLKAALDP